MLGGADPSDADVIIIATGSEVQLAVEATKMLAAKDIRAYTVSMPCVEWFESQPQEYRDSVLPRRCRPGGGGGRYRAELVQVRRRHRRDRLDRALRVRRRQDPVPRIRLHPEAVVAAAERAIDN